MIKLILFITLLTSSNVSWTMLFSKKKSLSDSDIPRTKSDDSKNKSPLSKSEGLYLKNPHKLIVKRVEKPLNNFPLLPIPPSLNGFLYAALILDQNKLLYFLKNLHFDPNIQDTNGDTALHIIARQYTQHVQNINEDCKADPFYETIKNISLMLISDYRINSFIKNNDHQIAQFYIKGKKEEDIRFRHLFFARYALDNLVNQEVELKKMQYRNGILWDEELDGIVNKIIQCGHIDQQQQTEDRILPKDARFPLYATENFIKNMILFRLSLLFKTNL